MLCKDGGEKKPSLSLTMRHLYGAFNKGGKGEGGVCTRQRGSDRVWPTNFLVKGRVVCAWGRKI